MGAYYDEVEIEDMVWDEVHFFPFVLFLLLIRYPLCQEKRVYHYPCPCGDRFEISREQLKAYEDIATCPSCSLVIRVVYDPVSFLRNETKTMCSELCLVSYPLLHLRLTFLPFLMISLTSLVV